MAKTQWALFVVMLLFISACGDTHSPKSQGQTHWLHQCDDDSDCGELSCECGVCVAPCGQDGQCNVAGLATECFSASSTAVEALCGSGRTSPPSLCLEACAGSCEGGQVCASGACIVETTAPLDPMLDSGHVDPSGPNPDPRLDAGSAPSHWLERCELDSDCGDDGLTCECGVCVTSCAPDGICDVSGLETTCFGPAGAVAATLCGVAESHAVCLEPCGGSSGSCDIDQVCAWGLACVPAPEPPTKTFTLGLRNMKTSAIYVQTEDCNGKGRWFDLRIDSAALDVQEGCDCRTADPVNGCPTPPPVCAEPVVMAIESGREITYTWDTGYWVQNDSRLCSNRFSVADNQPVTFRVCWLEEQPTQDELNGINYPADFTCEELDFMLIENNERLSAFWIEIND